MSPGARWRPGEAAAKGAELPLPRLALTSGVAEQEALDDALAAAGCRHIADLLRRGLPGTSRAAHFRVLDGVWFPGRGSGTWTPADLALVDAADMAWSALPQAAAAHRALALVRGRLTADTLAARRILLYQLGCLLRDSSASPAAAEALGVDPEEAGPLAAAVASRFPAAAQVRAAVRELPEAWADGKLSRVGAILAMLTPGHGDPEIEAVEAEAARLRASVGKAAAEARALAAKGAAEQAAQTWVEVLRNSTDEPGAWDALLDAALVSARRSVREHRGGTEIVHGSAVRVTWPADAPGAGAVLRVYRFPDARPAEAVPIGETRASSLTDPQPGVAVPLRYAAVPVADGRIAGVPWVSPIVMVTPEVGEAEAEAAPDGIRLTWRPHSAAVEIAVRRGSGRSGPCDDPVACDRFGALDTAIPLGVHRYRVACGYRTEDGSLAWSAGVVLAAEAVRWPTSVRHLSAEQVLPGRVRLSWAPPERGAVLVVPWQAGPVAPGRDVSRLLDELAPHTGEAYEPAAHATTRLTAVSVLDGRAVSGASVLIETPGRVRDLAAARTAPGTVEVRFAWPDPAVLVLVEWEQDGVRRSRRLARSAFRGKPAALPVTAAACTVTVRPLVRPDADIAVADAASVSVPAIPAPPAGPPKPVPGPRGSAPPAARGPGQAGVLPDTWPAAVPPAPDHPPRRSRWRSFPRAAGIRLRAWWRRIRRR